MSTASASAALPAARRRPTRRRPPAALAAALAALLLPALVAPATAGAAEPAPVERTGEWTSAAPADRGLDPEAVAAGVREIGDQPGTRSLLVVAGGELVVEETFRGGSTRAPHNLKSASKSLLSALVGIALERGVLPGLDAPVAELLPDALPSDAGDGRRRIELEHLLTMTAGLASTSGEHYGAWVSRDDWVRAALERPLEGPPGDAFRYSTGNTHLLSAILTGAAPGSTADFARRHLFDPLGVGEVSWSRSPEGIPFGGNNLTMSARDLARVGLLYLNGGTWDGGRVVAADWVERSTSRHVETPPDWAERYGDYGYLWWLPRGHDGAYAAVGYGGQILYVAPEAGVIVVLTSTLSGKGTAWDQRVMEIFRTRFAGGR